MGHALRWPGPRSEFDYARTLKVSPDGSWVFVTGSSDRPSSYLDFLTVAYDAETGAKLWATRYNGLSNGNDYAYGLGVSPDSSRVFVTGRSYGARAANTTVAYDASTGARLWTRRYDGVGGVALGVSPDGDPGVRDRVDWTALRHRGVRRPHGRRAVDETLQRCGERRR